MLSLFSAVRKFFDHEVQFAMGFLTRPVTGYGAQHYAGYGEYAQYDQCDLHHMRVPFNRPSTMLITTAKQNKPVSMYIKSI